jgi:hypothetical protein
MTNHVDKLRELAPVKEAYHDHQKGALGCLEGTRIELLDDIQAWFKDDSPNASPVFCLEGLAGTGKTAIAHSVCEQLDDNLGGAFFFSRLEHENRRNPSNVIPTLLSQLALTIPPLQSYICDAIEKDPDVASKKVFTQINKLITNGIALHTDDLPPFLIVLDALDECDEQEAHGGESSLLHIVQALLSAHPRTKIFLTTRPHESITNMLKKLRPLTNDHSGTILNGGKPFILHRIEGPIVSADIERYLRSEFKSIRLPIGRPTEDEIRTIVRMADRLFIYAATAIKFVSKGFSPKKNLDTFLSTVKGDRASSSPYAALDAVYKRIVRDIIANDGEGETDFICSLFRRIVGTIIAAQKPLSRLTLSRLLDEDEYDVCSVLQPLFSLLDIGASVESPIYIFHPSFPDFVQDSRRCSDIRFHIDVVDIHFMLALRCLRLLNEMLRENICNIEEPGRFNSEVPDLQERLAEHVSEELRYACTYWTTHLGLVSFESISEEEAIELIDAFHVFCRKHLFEWVEALSLLGSLRPAVKGVNRVIDWLEEPEIVNWLKVAPLSL